ncbi:MAG: PHP domain-containing protein [Alphaproteobacteria bacterium]|nr:PHP domain-containing protein [Alphaproteobacteria bacterium]
MQNFTLHTHTIGFDGKNTIAEMVARAAQLGMNAIGISNHFIVHPEITNAKFYPFSVARGYKNIYSSSFDEAIKLFMSHYQELERIAASANIRILRGMEVDFFPSVTWRRGFEQALKILQPDYLIGSCHFIEYDGVLCNVHDMAKADIDTQNQMLHQYWQNVATAAGAGLFDWMAHLDLPKKVGLGSEPQWDGCWASAVSAISANKTAIEINTGLATDFYPSAQILKMIANANIPVFISDDAHSVDQVARHFENAMDFAHNCGVNNFMTLDTILR